jgi:hypothetical protein
MIIAFPPCTDLAVSGARWFPEKQKDFRQQKSVAFFMHFVLAHCDKIAVENPIGIMSSIYKKPTQIIQPYEFGHPYSKKTCLWLKGLTKLKPTNVLTEYKPYVSCGTSHNKGNKDKAGVSRSGGAAKVRSKTFQGIARAMAQQWGDYLLGKTDTQLSFFEV